MQTHHNRRLFDLAQRNLQRLNLTELSSTSSNEVQRLWSGKPLIFHPETPTVIADVFSRCSEVHRDVNAFPTLSVRCLRTSSSTKAYEWLLTELLALPDQDYLASFGGGNTLNFETTSQWVPRYPITQVTATEVLAVFRASDRLAFEELALVSSSNTASLVLDSYIGFLPEEPNTDEIVYDLATFRDA